MNPFLNKEYDNAFLFRMVETPEQRRERIATAVLAGMWSKVSTEMIDYDGHHNYPRWAWLAKTQADALIAELDK